MTSMPILQNFLLDSPHFDVLRVSGGDAARFLQGQLTCDVAAVHAGGFTYGAACNNKGRVITPFLLYRQNLDFLLVFQQGLAALFTAALGKFLPFYKCSMTIDTSLQCIGLGGTAIQTWLTAQHLPTPAAGQALSLPSGWIAAMTGEQPQYLICSDTATLATLLPQELSIDDGTGWRAACLLNGHFPFAASDSELYTPQELHYEQKLYISFTKGCYTGQEIVARMHYRGKIKKQFYRVAISCEPRAAIINPGLLDEQGDLQAECIKTTVLPGGTALALAMLPTGLTGSQLEMPTTSGHHAYLAPF